MEPSRNAAPAASENEPGRPPPRTPYYRTAYNFPSAQATYTVSPATTGDAQTLPGNSSVHRAWPVAQSSAQSEPFPCML